jgi:FKBP-type peptidyl-prolyl cis-trans isomerase
MKRSVLIVTLFCAGATALATPPRTEGQLVEAWGWQVAHREDIAGVALSADERATFLAGAARAIDHQPPPCDLAIAFADLTKLADERRREIVAARRAHNEAQAAEWFSRLAQRDNLRHLPRGLCFEVLREGHGVPAEPKQTATVRYTGRLIDGTEFIHMDAYDVIVVPKRLSPALYEAIQVVKPGGAVRLFVPPALSAGEEAKLGIPVGAATIYELEVLEVKPTSAKDLANSLLPMAPEPEPPSWSGLSSARLIEAWGWSVVQRSEAAAILSDAADRSAFLGGLDAGLRNQPLTDGAERVRAANAYVATARVRLRQRQREDRLAVMTALFAQLDRQPGVAKQPDGLRYEILAPGDGPKPRLGDLVVVDYVGRLLNGTVFDRTDNEPLHIRVGSVIDGWDEGIQKIARGGRIRLYIPPALGYGDEDASGVLAKIPGASTLVYEVTLLDVQPGTATTPSSLSARAAAAHPISRIQRRPRRPCENGASRNRAGPARRTCG